MSEVGQMAVDAIGARWVAVVRRLLGLGFRVWRLGLEKDLKVRG